MKNITQIYSTIKMIRCDLSSLKVGDQFLCKIDILARGCDLQGCNYHINDQNIHTASLNWFNYHCMSVVEIYAHNEKTLAVKCNYAYYPLHPPEIIWDVYLKPEDILAPQSEAYVAFPIEYCKWHRDFQVGDKLYVALAGYPEVQLGILARVNNSGTGCVLLEDGTSVTVEFDQVSKANNEESHHLE